MDTTTLIWILGLSAAVNLLLLILLLRSTAASRRLRAEAAELNHALEIETSVAGHARPPHQRLIAVVINVTKEDAAEAVRLIHSACSRAGMPAPVVMASSAEDPGHVMTRRALEQGADVVIAAGGDGTVRAVAAELAGTGTALGVLPMGTGNLFARNIGLPYAHLETCVDEAIHGMGRRVDTLDLTLFRADGSSDEETSLVIAGGGLDAEVMGDTREALKQRAGWLAYGEAGLRHVTGRPRSITVTLDDGDPKTYRVRSVLMANCGSLQAGMVLVPSARFDDGKLDAVLFSPRHVVDWAKIITKTITRFKTEIPVMKVRQAERTLVSMAEPMPFQIDGDAVGEVVRVRTTVRPASLVVNGVSTSHASQDAMLTVTEG